MKTDTHETALNAPGGAGPSIDKVSGRREADVPASDDVRAVAGLVLAGGMSSRFGSDKSRWHFDGLPLRERALQQVQAVADHVMLSVRKPVDVPAGVSCVLDRFPGKGPLAGLHAGLLDATQDWVVVVPCDTPYLLSADLKVLIAARDHDVDAVVARDIEGRLHPLCACYHRSTVAVIRKLLAGQERSMHRLLSQIRYRAVLLPSHSLRNVNRPSDLTD